MDADGQPVGETQPRALARWWLWAEMAAIFFGVPGVVALYVDPQRRLDAWLETLGIALPELPVQRFQLLMPMLVVFTLLIAAVLVFSKQFPTRQLWGWASFKHEFGRILKVFVLGALVMFALAWALHEFTDVMNVRGPDGERGSTFLFLPRTYPMVLVVIAIAYPVLSAYPQEVTHRAFFFHRYRAILPGRWAMIGVNAAAFAWLHVPFWNWIALTLTLPAGVLFAWTYDRTRSTLAAGFEHAIYGWWLFFTGLGFFVYAGSLGA